MHSMGKHVVSLTSDRGTERGIADAPPVTFGSLFEDLFSFDFSAEAAVAGEAEICMEDVLHMPSALSVSGGLHLVN
eukprot:8180375-Alexandrium_andersonii.AAC.1